MVGRVVEIGASPGGLYLSQGRTGSSGFAAQAGTAGPGADSSGVVDTEFDGEKSWGIDECQPSEAAELPGKGRGNTKNGNKYLSWAFVEAANFAIRHDPKIKRYYQRKRARTHAVVAIKTVAHKLARACFYLLRDQVPFDVERAFA